MKLSVEQSSRVAKLEDILSIFFSCFSHCNYVYVYDGDAKMVLNFFLKTHFFLEAVLKINPM